MSRVTIKDVASLLQAIVNHKKNLPGELKELLLEHNADAVRLLEKFKLPDEPETHYYDSKWYRTTWDLYGYYIGGKSNHIKISMALEEVEKILNGHGDIDSIVVTRKEK